MYIYIIVCTLIVAELTDEQKEIQQVARKFTQEEVIPNARHHDQTGEVSILVIEDVDDRILINARLQSLQWHNYWYSS